MLPKWTTSHTFQVVIGCVMAVLTYLVKDPTIGPYAQPVLAVLTVILGYLGLSSGRAFGSGGSGGGGGIEQLPGPQFKMPKAPPENTSLRKSGTFMRRTIVWAACAFGVVACGKPLPPNTPADVEGALGCVVNALIAGGNLVGCIAQWGPALVADALQMLTESKQFAADHPELVPMLAPKLAEVRAQVHP